MQPKAWVRGGVLRVVFCSSRETSKRAQPKTKSINANKTKSNKNSVAADNVSVCDYWSVSELIFKIINRMVIWTYIGCLSSVLICMSVFSVLIISIFISVKSLSGKSFQCFGKKKVFITFFGYTFYLSKHRKTTVSIISVMK